MGRNNFGWKSRQISKAGKFALNHFAQHRIISYSTMQSLGHRWVLFADWIKENGKVRWLEDLTRDHVIEHRPHLRGEIVFLPGTRHAAVDHHVARLRRPTQHQTHVGLIEIPMPRR